MPRTPGLRPQGKTEHEETRRNNRRLVLQGIFDDGPISRADLARSTSLGRATVSDIVGSLLTEDLVVEAGLGASTGGKPPTLVELNTDGRFTVAVDLARHPIEAVLLNLRGRIVGRASGKSVAPRSRDALQELHRVVAELMGSATSPALGIGVGVPGTVDREGRVVTSEQLRWEDAQLRDELEDVYGIPAYVASDAEVAAVAEFGKIAVDPAGRMLYVKVDDRIAVALITAGRLNRTPVRGGDLTHIRVGDWDDECGCERVGCLGCRVSMIRVLGPDYLEMSTDARKRVAVDSTPRVDRAARDLGRAIAPIVAAVDADIVVVGGELGTWPSVPEHLAAGIGEYAGWCPQVAATQLDTSAVLLGAASMVLSGELGVVWG